MKAICHTNPANPAQSLIKQVCYSKTYAITSKQTSWGCMHEKAARDRYVKTMKGAHTNFNVTDSGFIINPELLLLVLPQMERYRVTAAVRGLRKSSVHTVKKVRVIEASTHDAKFCIQRNVDGVLKLDHSHAYYYQVQTQLFVCNATFVYVHSPKMKSMIFSKNVFLEMLNLARLCLEVRTFFQNIDSSRVNGKVVYQNLCSLF